MQNCGFKFNNSYLSLPDEFYTRLNPSPVANPKMIILNDDLAHSMGLDFSNLSKQKQAELFSGNNLPEGSEPLSQAYAGHQFGHFVMLGDGRAHVWGEHITPENKRLDIQFKGSGHTPYSRRGDGRATLGPMLREYIISEAIHALGIPTTRSLAVVTTGEDVMRETLLQGAMLTRVASSHIRVGTFQFAAAQDNKALIQTLLNYTVNRHAPEIKGDQNLAVAFLKNVIERQSDLIVHWMRVGFIHGVMNTDNMTISGETIDYGPCAFMDTYEPNTVFSSIDHMGRYAYVNQPAIAQWNIARLAETLLPLIDDNMSKAIEIAEETINEFSTIYQRKWLTMMRAKLGLFGIQSGDEELICDLLNLMQNNHADYTNTFYDLSNIDKPTDKLYEQKHFEDWYFRWQNRLTQNSKSLESSICQMQNTNPAVIPRNHKVEEALEAANQGDFKPFQDLLAVLKEPYNDRVSLKPYQALPKPTERVYQTFCGT